MIDSNFFKKKITQLEAAFGYEMPENRLSIYWKYLNKEFDNKRFEYAVETLILNCKRFPTIADFMEVGSDHRTLL